MSLVSDSLRGPLPWQIARGASGETRGKPRPRGAPPSRVPVSARSAQGRSGAGRRGSSRPRPPSRLSARAAGPGPRHQPRLPRIRNPEPKFSLWAPAAGPEPAREGAAGERAAGEGASRSALPASAALGLRSGGCSSKLRQVSTSSPRGGGRARHREARTASAAWHRGPPDPHTPLMPGTPRHCEQPPEPAPWPHWGGARRPQEDPPRSGPPRLRSAFNHFPAGSPPLTWHPAAAGESGASRPPPLHSGTGLSPSGFEEMAVALPPGGRKAWERAWDAAPRSTAWRDLARASPSLSCFLCQRSVIASASRAAQGHTDSVCENIG